MRVPIAVISLVVSATAALACRAPVDAGTGKDWFDRTYGSRADAVALVRVVGTEITDLKIAPKYPVQTLGLWRGDTEITSFRTPARGTCSIQPDIGDVFLIALTWNAAGQEWVEIEWSRHSQKSDRDKPFTRTHDHYPPKTTNTTRTHPTFTDLRTWFDEF